jgi:hypothetical protein
MTDISHVDVLGQPIKIGDTVACVHGKYNKLWLKYVVDLTKQKVVLSDQTPEEFNVHKYAGRKTTIYPSQTIVFNVDKVADETTELSLDLRELLKIQK